MKVNEEKALEIGRRVVTTERMALKSMEDSLDHTFVAVLNEMERCKGKVILTGMGKSGHVARKIAATMSSLGISSFFLHPGEAMHGDLGMVEKEDMVIAISYSGESEEVIKIVPNIKRIGAKIVAITSNIHSTLAKRSDLIQVFPCIKEACHLGLAPTTSTTVVMAYGDALAVALSELRGFSKNQFGLYHPSGSLGKKLTMKVTDVMNVLEEIGVEEDALLKEAILQFGRFGTDLLPVVSKEKVLFGIITNGEVERAIQKQADIYRETISSMVNFFPVYVEADTMAISALQIMIQNQIHSLPVVKEERVIGIVSKETILQAGVYI